MCTLLANLGRKITQCPPPPSKGFWHKFLEPLHHTGNQSIAAQLVHEQGLALLLNRPSQHAISFQLPARILSRGTNCPTKLRIGLVPNTTRSNVKQALFAVPPPEGQPVGEEPNKTTIKQVTSGSWVRCPSKFLWGGPTPQSRLQSMT